MSGNALERATIERLGQRGEGIATVDGTRLYVPYALPGEVVTVDRDGDRGALVGIIEPSLDRVAPICPYFTNCGGCAVQALAHASYAKWKRGILVAALARASVAIAVAPLVDAHGAGRRRATFHARLGADGRPTVGFMQARAHVIVPLAACPILDPRLDGALPAARAVAAALMSPALSSRGEPKPLDILCTATDSGLDVDLRGHGPLSDDERTRLTSAALTHGLARLANHGTVVLERQKPIVTVCSARIELPPGAFLQATNAGEEALATRVVAAMVGAKRAADLFSGFGTFALRLATFAEVTAFDSDSLSLAALNRAARAAPSLRQVAIEVRDLQHRPLTVDELSRFDSVCLDPPRAGAEAQMRALAASELRTVVSVSCDAMTFARDAAILLAGGFKAEAVEPIDQFRYSAHIEIIAVFRRAAAKRKRRLLG